MAFAAHSHAPFKSLVYRGCSTPLFLCPHHPHTVCTAAWDALIQHRARVISAVYAAASVADRSMAGPCGGDFWGYQSKKGARLVTARLCQGMGFRVGLCHAAVWFWLKFVAVAAAQRLVHMQFCM
jgi:hypothetical protein